jgi:hypothetical protein
MVGAAILALLFCQSPSLVMGQVGAPVSSPASAAAVPAQPASTDAKPAGLRVFYAAHSLMWDTPNPVVELAKAYGIADHVLAGMQSLGFSYTRQHWEQPDAQNKAKQALNAGNVDVFIMSPMELPDAGIDSFVKYGLEFNAKTRFYCQNNWTAFNTDGQKQHQMGGGNRVGWDQTTVEMLKTLDATYEKAFEDQVGKLNKEIGRKVLFVIPTSQAVTAIRIKIAQNEFPGLDRQSQLFADQIGHPAAPLIALNAYVHFATIYGRSPVGLPIPTILKNARNEKFDEGFNKRLQELAWKTVLDYSEWDGVKAPAAKTSPMGSMSIKPDPRVQQRTYHFKEADKDLSYVFFASSKVSPLIINAPI